jgi:serine/threonine protein kinase
VKICFHMLHQCFYAVKILKKGFSLADLQAFVNEVDLISKIGQKSKYVPKIIDANFNGDYCYPDRPTVKTCYYVMELAEYGELFRFIKQGPQLPEPSIRFLFIKILNGKNPV